MTTTTGKQPEAEVASLGLRGMWAHVANLTAVGLICLLFYQSHNDTLKTAREERLMFREELRLLHADADRQWESMTTIGRNLEKLTEDMRMIQMEIREMRRKDTKGNP